MKRRIVLACGLGVAVAAILVLLWLAPSTTTEPAQAPAAMASKAPMESPDHELKALAMQLEKKPGHVPVLMRMAELEGERGKLDDAAAHLREAVKSEPTNLDARLELGRALYRQGDIQGAIAETEKILATSPDHPDALYNLGAIYANLGNADRARSYWTKAAAARDADSGRKAREGLDKLSGS